MNCISKEEAEGLAKHLREVFPSTYTVTVEPKDEPGNYYVLFKSPTQTGLSVEERRFNLIMRNVMVRDALRSYAIERDIKEPVRYWRENVVTMPTGVKD